MPALWRERCGPAEQPAGAGTGHGGVVLGLWTPSIDTQQVQQRDSQLGDDWAGLVGDEEGQVGTGGLGQQPMLPSCVLVTKNDA